MRLAARILSTPLFILNEHQPVESLSNILLRQLAKQSSVTNETFTIQFFVNSRGSQLAEQPPLLQFKHKDPLCDSTIMKTLRELKHQLKGLPALMMTTRVVFIRVSTRMNTKLITN
jgi:hypothetical protein